MTAAEKVLSNTFKTAMAGGAGCGGSSVVALLLPGALFWENKNTRRLWYNSYDKTRRFRDAVTLPSFDLMM